VIIVAQLLLTAITLKEAPDAIATLSSNHLGAFSGTISSSNFFAAEGS
jgi:hypothetical protein